MKQPCVDILASKRNGTLYVGVTGDVVRRCESTKLGESTASPRSTTSIALVYAEFHPTMDGAILREKRVKKWRRAWKLALIDRDNPMWRDLYDEYAGSPGPPLSRG